jgi:hypothetical protein
VEVLFLERGVYFDGWYKNNHCYHPSLPLRSMQMIEDLERYKGTLLVWSALGGGSISLSYLEHEAFGKVDPRLRFYGYMNDSEFIAECNKRGIKVFGIVFEVQGWEFPAVISDDKNEFKGLNVIRDNAPHDWYGLREFTADKYYEVFGKKFSDYFPDGLYNSDGEQVTNIWEECCARDFNGIPCHAEWVEVKNHEHIAYSMCRNNPVWREYLKQIIKIQINAGVAGIQLDECELPMTSVRYGGCFCKDCMKQFNSYLKELDVKGKLPDELKGVDLDTFNYGEYLKGKNVIYPGNIDELPLYRYYWEFQLRAIKKYFKELADFAREYGKKQGRSILVSGNFFDIMPCYYPMETSADVIITEMKQSILKQAHWYRYVAGFAGEKPVIVAENPYGSAVYELVDLLNEGKGYDLYRLLLIEASAYGCNMSVPYGAWMGNTVKDAFWPPRNVTVEVQEFLVNNERLFSKKSGANVLVLYSFPSNYWPEAVAGYSSSVLDDSEGVLSYSVVDPDDPNGVRMPFWEVTRKLSQKQVSYDVKFLADNDLREDTFSLNDIDSYDLIVLPDCNTLTENQAAVIEKYARQGKSVLLFGEAAANLPGWFDKMKCIESVTYCENDSFKPTALQNFDSAFLEAYKDLWKVTVDNDSLGLQIHSIESGMAIHLINYDYSKQKDRIEEISEVNIKVHLMDNDFISIKGHTLQGTDLKVESHADGNVLNIKIHDLPLYAVVELVNK